MQNLLHHRQHVVQSNAGGMLRCIPPPNQRNRPKRELEGESGKELTERFPQQPPNPAPDDSLLDSPPRDAYHIPHTTGWRSSIGNLYNKQQHGMDNPQPRCPQLLNCLPLLEWAQYHLRSLVAHRELVPPFSSAPCKYLPSTLALHPRPKSMLAAPLRAAGLIRQAHEPSSDYTDAACKDRASG